MAEERRVGVSWFARETIFVVLGMVLWASFGWRVLWGVIPVALVGTLLVLRRHRAEGRSAR
jgi:hypothetical protein